MSIMTEQDFETEAEREEREAVESGQVFDALTDAEWTTLQDAVAEAADFTYGD